MWCLGTGVRLVTPELIREIRGKRYNLLTPAYHSKPDLFQQFWICPNLDFRNYRWVPPNLKWILKSEFLVFFSEVLCESYVDLSCVICYLANPKFASMKDFTWYYFFEFSGKYLQLPFPSNVTKPQNKLEVSLLPFTQIYQLTFDPRFQKIMFVHCTVSCFKLKTTRHTSKPQLIRSVLYPRCTNS